VRWSYSPAAGRIDLARETLLVGLAQGILLSVRSQREAHRLAYFEFLTVSGLVNGGYRRGR